MTTLTNDEDSRTNWRQPMINEPLMTTEEIHAEVKAMYARVRVLDEQMHRHGSRFAFWYGIPGPAIGEFAYHDDAALSGYAFRERPLIKSKREAA
jgi:hypothetical protein